MRSKSILTVILCCTITTTSFAQVTPLKISALVKQFIKLRTDTFALTDAEVIDGTGGPVKDHETILVENGRIANVGNTGSVSIPQRIMIISCTGKTIIPGMVMMHEHQFYGESVQPLYLGMPMPVSFPRLYLAGGVTTLRTTGTSDAPTDLNNRDWIKEGKIPGPDMDVTAPYIEAAGFLIPEILFIKTAHQAAEEVNYWADMGCTSIKLYQDLTRAEAKAAIDAAHKRGLKVTGHLCSVTYREAAEMGIDNLEHGFWVCSDFDPDKKKDSADFEGRDKSLQKLDEHSPAMKSLMAYLIKKNVTITSTLPVFMPFSGREIFPGGADSAVAPEIRENVEKSYRFVTGTVRGKSYDSAEVVRYKKELFWEKQFADMGGKLMAGIDPTGAGRVIPGYADRIVPGLLMEAGFTLPQAIKICSLNAAEYLGKEKQIGSITVGKRADLVLINGDVEVDIKNMRNTEIVFKNGIGWDSKKIFDSVKGLVGLY